MSAFHYFEFRPEQSRFGDIAHDIKCAELMFEGLLDHLPTAHAQGRLEAWRKAAHSIIDLIGDEPVERNPSLSVMQELEATRTHRLGRQQRLLVVPEEWLANDRAASAIKAVEAALAQQQPAIADDEPEEEPSADEAADEPTTEQAAEMPAEEPRPERPLLSRLFNRLRRP